MSAEAKALRLVWSLRRFWLLHFVVTLAVVGAAVGWFWIPDSSLLSVTASFGLAMIVVAAALVWIGATLVYYHGPCVPAALKSALRRLPSLLIWGLIAAALTWIAAPRLPWWAAWILLPAALLPLAYSVSRFGFGGFKPNTWPLRFLRAYPIAAAVGIFVPWALAIWHPALPGIGLQTASLVIRLAAASAIAVTAWLFLAALLAVQEESPVSTS